MLRKLLPVVCLLLVLLTALPASAATLVTTTEVVTLPDAITPIDTYAQASAWRVSRMLDNDPATCYSYTTWTSTGADDVPEVGFTFNSVSLSEIWLRIGDQSSVTAYYNNSRPLTIRVRVNTRWNSYDYVYSMDDVYDVTRVGGGWLRGYQALSLPNTLYNVQSVDFFITRWATGNRDKYNVCISDVLFAGSPTSAYEPTITTSPWDEQISQLEQQLSGLQSVPVRIPATLNQRMATRSGPCTAFDELGSYFTPGHQVTALTCAWDEVNELWWVQVEFTYGTELRRAYTGSQRVNIDVGMLPQESLKCTATLAYPVRPTYGPGNNYSLHKDFLAHGSPVSVYAVENGFAQVEFYDYGINRHRRVWVPSEALVLD